MIEIFRTNVRTRKDAKNILVLLNGVFSDVQANFDLHDRDKILRLRGIETRDIPKLKSKLAELGFICEILL